MELEDSRTREKQWEGVVQLIVEERGGTSFRHIKYAKGRRIYPLLESARDPHRQEDFGECAPVGGVVIAPRHLLQEQKGGESWREEK